MLIIVLFHGNSLLIRTTIKFVCLQYSYLQHPNFPIYELPLTTKDGSTVRLNASIFAKNAGTVRFFVMVRVRYVGTVRLFCKGTGMGRWFALLIKNPKTFRTLR